MKQKITYSKLVKLYPILLIVVLLFVYLFSVKDTLALRADCNALTAQSATASDAPATIAAMQTKLDEINTLAGKNDQEAGSDPLLGFISNSALAGRISLVDYQSPHIYRNQNYQVETRITVLEGSFINLLKFLNHLENNFKAGKLVSVKYESEINYKTNRKRLLMTLYTQIVINDNKAQDSIATNTIKK